MSKDDVHRIYVFEVGGQPYGIDIAAIREVKEIGSREAITPVPHIQDPVIGYINVRGEINQVLSLHRILLGCREELSEIGLVLYFKKSMGPSFGAYADRLRDVLTVEERQLDRWEAKADPAGTLGDFVTCGVCRRERELIPLVSAQRLYQSVFLPDTLVPPGVAAGSRR